MISYASLPALFHAAGITLFISVTSYSIGVLGGIMLSICHTYAPGYIQKLITLYVALIRGTPLLIQITFWYFFLPVIGIHISALSTAILAFGLNSIAYISQNIKASLLAINVGQFEAAQTLGFSFSKTMYYIILPQAFKIALPTLGNEFSTLIKDSSLASAISVVELYKEGRHIIDQTYDVISVFCIIALFYLVMTSAVAYGVYLLERKLNNASH